MRKKHLTREQHLAAANLIHHIGADALQLQRLVCHALPIRVVGRTAGKICSGRTLGELRSLLDDQWFDDGHGDRSPYYGASCQGCGELLTDDTERSGGYCNLCHEMGKE